MAKKTENESFVDMFKSFGEQLKMPSVDVEKIIEHHRKNLETLEKTAKAATEGASNLMAKQREILQETLREVTDMAQNFRATGGPHLTGVVGLDDPQSHERSFLADSSSQGEAHPAPASFRG